MRALRLLGLSAVLAGGTALAQVDYDHFQQWDANDDSAINSWEFEEGLAGAGTFEARDTNDDDWIGESEFRPAENTGFNTWDADGDRRLSRDEYATGLYDTLDTDDDGALSADEWRGAQTAGWFEG